MVKLRCQCFQHAFRTPSQEISIARGANPRHIPAAAWRQAAAMPKKGKAKAKAVAALQGFDDEFWGDDPFGSEASEGASDDEEKTAPKGGTRIANKRGTREAEGRKEA